MGYLSKPLLRMNDCVGLLDQVLKISFKHIWKCKGSGKGRITASGALGFGGAGKSTIDTVGDAQPNRISVSNPDSSDFIIMATRYTRPRMSSSGQKNTHYAAPNLY
ncbi:hypothetical protein ACO0LM_28135 [Undibacterium sp. Di26W]|uniref:hypothetical protein n=1 Tax=Undibacterium sp. Di26W TaxID=3413035 RepID=UPI003BF40735